MGKIFGTDGVRGEVNVQLTPQLAFNLGRAAAYVLGKQMGKKGIIIGKDTRLSGDMLEAALTAGICSVGIDVYHLGVIPTPAIAFLTKHLQAMAGVVISASHNPAGDNGIKFFNHLGFKLSDEVEEKIEELIENKLKDVPFADGRSVGRIQDITNAKEIYRDYLKKQVSLDLQGMKIVVDCANGAASQITPLILKELGAEVITIFAEPDGLNINLACGSTHPEKLQKRVVEEKADLGIAHDGDSDRMLAVDEKGNLVDGDQILTTCALHMKKNNTLKGNKLVVTVMSNLGLKEALEKENIEVLETKVGDRYVLEKMQEVDAVLGGEQSGHIIFLEDNTTGDGVLSALKLLEVVKSSGQSLSQLAGQMKKFPQVLKNVAVKNKIGWEENQIIQAIIAKNSFILGKEGRVLVRASGTEPLIRVMIEGKDLTQIKAMAEDIAKVIEKELNC